MWFVSRKTMEREIKHREDLIDLMRSGYAAHLKSLQTQIESLEKLVFPKNTSQEIPKEARELDAVISVSEKPPEMSEEDLNKILAGHREMDLLMSGNYDTDLMQ